MNERLSAQSNISKFPARKDGLMASWTAASLQKSMTAGSMIVRIPTKQTTQQANLAAVSLSPKNRAARTSVKNGPVFCTIDTSCTLMSISEAFRMSMFEPPNTDRRMSSLERLALGLLRLSLSELSL